MGLQTHFLWCVHLAIVFFFNLILMTAIGSRPKPEICFLSGLLRWTFLPKERYGDPLSGRGSNTEPYNWEADTVTLSYRRLSGYIVIWSQFCLFAKFKVV